MRRPSWPVGLFLVIGLGFSGAAVYAYRDAYSGEAADAKVERCTGYGKQLHCTGSWVAGGSLVGSGHVIVGDIRDADDDDVGKTIRVRIHGDHATKPSATAPIVLAAFGLLGLVCTALVWRS